MILLFFLLWILLSGNITPEICLTGVVVSVVLCFLEQRILEKKFCIRKPSIQKLWGNFSYLFYLIWEILKAGFVVMKLIYTKGKDTEPLLVYFQSSLKEDNSNSALADSITLTAGTITVSAENGLFCVHALDRSLAEGIEDCEFERRLAKLER